MNNAIPVLPFKTRRPTRRHYFLRVNFQPFSFFMRTTVYTLYFSSPQGVIIKTRVCKSTTADPEL